MKRFLIFSILLTLISCKKSAFLDKKPSESLVVPSTLQDYQALLDETNLMNGSGNGIVPALGEAGADDYFVIASAIFKTELKDPLHLNIYTWNDNLYTDPTIAPADWGLGYKSIFTSNVVLEGLRDMQREPDETSVYDNVKGSALFFRAHMFYQLAQVFAKQYNKSSASEDLGIPLKLEADINEKIVRATVKETYDRIIMDLKEAASLLPDKPLQINRPSKWAAFALLARVYLVMGEYEDALTNASSCLNINDQLLDYNSVPNPNEAFPLPLPQENPEMIFYAVMNRISMSLLMRYSCRIDSTLVASYPDNDLRKTMYARDASIFGRPGDAGSYFSGSYDKSDRFFAGLAVDEVYLIRAESQARLGNVVDAMADLNHLLKHRWNQNVVYVDLTASTPEEALNIILVERRKELLFRGLRWSDLRRLNQEGANISIKRIALGEEYMLNPNDPHYTYLIPGDVLQFNPDLQQNPR